MTATKYVAKKTFSASLVGALNALNRFDTWHDIDMHERFMTWAILFSNVRRGYHADGAVSDEARRNVALLVMELLTFYDHVTYGDVDEDFQRSCYAVTDRISKLSDRNK